MLLVACLNTLAPHLPCARSPSKSNLDNPCLRLHFAMQRVLSSYAAELLKRMPKTAAGGTSAQTPFNGTDWYVRLPDEEEGVLTCILATAEYCRCVTGQWPVLGSGKDSKK
eukprot:GHRR01026084.1.p1 GENE.GHRR01026084.1~~GHRR01026084.1.p1  ORF type:complete len:111 (-),score=36.19 GHRR01026084.1:521-853(-)